MTPVELTALLREPEALDKLAEEIGQVDPNAALYRCTDDARRSATRDAVAMDLLRKVSASLVACVRGAGDPVGR